MKTVCLLANSAFTILNFRREFIELLKARGYKVVVLCPERCALMKGQNIKRLLSEAEVEFYPVHINRTTINPFLDIWFFFQVLLALKRINPHVLISYTIKPTIYGSIAARLARIRLIASNITGIGYVFTAKSLKAKIIRLIVKFQYKIALTFNKIVFFQNPDDRNLFIDFGVVDASKVKVINGSGVDTKKFIRKKPISFSKSFLFVGRLLKDKGIYEYLNAAKLVKLKHKDASFSILGAFDDNPSNISREELEQYERVGIVSYLGTSSNVVDVYNQHSVFVLPSYREGTPRSSLEAMSMMMPIITTDVPGCRETVVHGENGILVPPYNEHALADAMNRLIDNPRLVDQMSAQSRYIAESKYDVQRVNHSILDELEKHLID